MAYENDRSKNINISYIGDLLSRDDATGNTINIQSVSPENDGIFDQHANGSFKKELNMILDVLKDRATNASNLFNIVRSSYKKYDESRSNGGNSEVSKGDK